MKRDLRWPDFLILSLPALVLALFAFAIVDAVYEAVTCKSGIFVDEGPRRQLRCVTGKRELKMWRDVIAKQDQ